MQRIDAMFAESPLLVFDGAMSTPLEHMGADLNHRLWTAKVLADDPDMIVKVHKGYMRAGADLNILATYQATIPGLTENGWSLPEAEDIIKRAVHLFFRAREEFIKEEGLEGGRPLPLGLAGIGPYGAYLADGSEYRGNYGVSDDVLYDFHARRMELLMAEGCEGLLIETQPSLREALIEAAIAEELGAEYAVSFSCKDGESIHEGDSVRDCAKALSKDHPNCRMIGVNCTKPVYVESLIKNMKAETHLPVSAYPNSGQTYDPVTKRWNAAADTRSFKDYAKIYYQAGAAAVGGCCTTTAWHIAQVAEARDEILAGRQ